VARGNRGRRDPTIGPAAYQCFVGEAGKTSVEGAQEAGFDSSGLRCGERHGVRPRECVRGLGERFIKKIAHNSSSYYVDVHNSEFPDGALRGQLHN
jgi:hypothetical protein